MKLRIKKLANKYGNKNFLTKKYFVLTFVLKDEVVREYIRKQEL